jgi:predicted dehydrogenase
VAVARLRVAVVGAGFIGCRHLAVLCDSPGVRVVAVADADSSRAAANAPAGAAVYDDHAELLERERVDALLICVPPFAHGPPERAAIERGIPFLVEKPVACDLAMAEALATEVRDAGLLTAVGYHWRYLDTTARAAALAADRPPRLVLGHWLDQTPPPPWWSRRSSSGGQLVEQATHLFDLVRLLVGDVEEVSAHASRTPRGAFPHADVDDVAVAALRFASGAVGSIAATCLLAYAHRIELQLFAEGLALELSERELRVHDGRDGRCHVASGDPFVVQDRAFLEAVRGGPDDILCSYDEALATHRLVCAAVESAAVGRPVATGPRQHA